MNWEFIGNRDSKVIHKIINYFGRYWRSGCDVQDENEDVFASLDDALAAVGVGWQPCSKCWRVVDETITFPGDSGTSTMTVNPTTGGAE